MSNQTKLYSHMMKQTLTDTCVDQTDYFKVAEINNILYYSPNDEELGGIVAISHEHKLAYGTGFYEMDDMEDLDSDYNQVVHEGRIVCRCEVK